MRITTVRELIERLGGTKAVGRMCGGIGKTAISDWRTKNRIPDKHKMRLFRECEERRLDVAPDLFDETTV